MSKRQSLGRILKEKHPEKVIAASDIASAAVDQKFREKVDIAKQELADAVVPNLMAKWIADSKEYEELNKRIKELNVEFEAVSQLLKAKFIELGVESLRDERTGELFYQQVDVDVKVTDLDKFEEWVESDPANDHLWSVHAGTRNTLVKHFLEKGDDANIPPGLDWDLRVSVRSRKS